MDKRASNNELMDTAKPSNGSASNNTSEAKKSILERVKNTSLEKNGGGKFWLQLTTVVVLIIVSVYHVVIYHQGKTTDASDSHFWHILLSTCIGILLPTPTPKLKLSKKPQSISHDDFPDLG